MSFSIVFVLSVCFIGYYSSIVDCSTVQVKLISNNCTFTDDDGTL